MKIRKVSFVTLIFGLSLLLNCKKKEDPDPKDRIPAHSFIDQDLQGKIFGKPWKFKTGTRKKFFEKDDAFLFLTDTILTHADTCDNYGYGNRKIRVSLPLALQLKTYGLAEDLYSCDLVDGTKYVRANGAIEITSIKGNVVSGRIHATVDSNNTVDGNFRITTCPE